jgi:hypothetical protein
LSLLILAPQLRETADVCPDILQHSGPGVHLGRMPEVRCSLDAHAARTRAALANCQQAGPAALH